MSDVLRGKRVIVTGAARGIGAAIAEAYVEAGAVIAILDLRADDGERTARRLGGRFHHVDLSDAEGARAAMDEAIGHLGGVDVLVNNAGALAKSSILDMDVAEWDRIFAINLRSMLVTTQVAARDMISRGAPGKIVNMASMAGKAGGAREGHYAAAKAGVIALTRVTALELGRDGITANALCPGYVLTAMGEEGRTPENVAEWSSLSPLGRLGKPEDVARVALFLASDGADYLTGQAFNVTGGMIMH